MRKFLRRSLCCLLSLVLAFSCMISVVAADDDSATSPVVVINDIYANPIYNTDDGTVIFNLGDYQYDLLFASGFSSQFLNIISDEITSIIEGEELSVLDIATALMGAFGYDEDINRIVNSVIDIAIQLLGDADISNLDVSTILSSIDLKTYFEGLISDLKYDIALLDYLEMNSDGTPAFSNTGAMLFEESLEYYYDYDYEFAYSLAGDIGESIAESVGYDNTYIFTYDWRLDPAVNAENLDEFIAHVKSETGAEKVSVISEGYGSVIATEYLAEFENAAKDSVKNFVTVSSEFLGTSVMGDLFKGEIAEKNIFTITNYTSAYIRYTNDLSDNPITAFTMWLLNYIMNTEWEAQDFCMDVADGLTGLYSMLKATGTLEQLSYMPGLWALVPSEDLDAALDNMFKTEIDDALFDSICAFKDNQDSIEDILVGAKNNGINISVVAGWDIQILPIGQNLDVQSDGVVDTAYASFGATCVSINDVADAMLAVQETYDGHDHMSADYDMLTPWYSYGGACYYIDASTCILPENTWFIKNMKHGTFEYESNSMDFIIWLVTADAERTVWDDASYKQFMAYNRYIEPGILMSSGIKAPAEDNVPGKYLLGDVNLDGYITSVDSRLAARVVDGIDELEVGSVQFMNADVDADGVVTDADAQFILDMSTGIIEEYSVGIKVSADTDSSALPASECEIELSPEYNSATNKIEITVYVVNAVDSYAGNFVVDYDESMFTYSSAKCKEYDDIYVSAGEPCDYGSVLTVAYSTAKSVTSTHFNEDGKLELATFYLDVTRRDINETSVTAGSTYFYDDGSRAYVAPVETKLDEDFFFVYGDIDDNRYISPADARYILRAAAKLEIVEDDTTFKRCDVNLDGSITPSDARLVLRAAAHIEDSFVN